MIEHKEICLEINGKQNLKLESGTIKFKNYFKQIAVTFKIYVDFASLFTKLQINDRDKSISYTEKYQDHIPCSFAYKVECIDDKFSKPAALYIEKMQSISLLKPFLKNMIIAKKVIKNILIKVLSCL